MDPRSFDVVVIGGGLAGLAVALGATQTNLTVCLLERERDLGGMARTLRSRTPQGVFSTDITGHFLHLRSTRLADEIPWLIEGLVTYERASTAIVSDNTASFCMPAPIQNNLAYLPLHLQNRVQNELTNLSSTDNAPEMQLGDYLERNYGAWLGSVLLCLNTKMYGSQSVNFRLSQYGRFFPHANRRAMLEQLESVTSSHPIYNSTFLYTGLGSGQAGIGLLADRLSERLRRLEGIEIYSNSEVTRWDETSHLVDCRDGRQFAGQWLVNTMPLDRFLSLNSAVTNEGNAALEGRDLNWWWVGGSVDHRRPPLDGAHWTYFTDPNIQCVRAGVYSNVDRRMAPDGCFSAWIEFPESKSPEVDKHAEFCQRIGLCFKAEDILFCHQYRIENAYCLENPQVSAIARQLRTAGIILAGRAGQWAYLSMEDVILQGLDIGRNLPSQPVAPSRT